MCLTIWQASIVSVWMLTNESSHPVQGDLWVCLPEKERWEDPVLLTETAWKTSEAERGCAWVFRRPEVRKSENWATHWALLQSWLLVQLFSCGWRALGFLTRISVHDVTYSCRIRAFTSVGCKGDQISLICDILGQFYLECCRWDQRHRCRAQAKMKMWESVVKNC